MNLTIDICQTKNEEDILRNLDEMRNINVPKKCEYCEYYFNFICMAEQCKRKET